MDTPPAAPVPNYPAQPPKSSGRKWLFWGCGGCLTLLLVGVLAFAGIFVFVIGVIKKTDVYADALKAADQSSEVQAALGSPIEAGWMPQGRVNMENNVGEADFTIPLSGPKGKGTLVVKASKTAGGAWVYSVLEVQTADGTRLELRKP